MRPITHIYRLLLQAFIFVIILAGCSKHTYKTVYPALHDNRYDAEFPYANCSQQLETILKSVKKVTCYTNYRTYVFGTNSNITLNDLNIGQVKDKAEASIYTNEATSGTAVIIQSTDKQMLLLTCAHIVDLPDTLISYSEYGDLQNQFIHSISLKVKQQIVIKDVPENNRFSILCSDRKKDIAILGRTFSVPAATPIPPPFDYPFGDSDHLEWGSFVYLAGYPVGQLMITKGIVSKAPDKTSNFLTDASFNEGLSGGIVLAIKDGVPNFELVGISRSVSARNEYFLKPEKDIHEFNYNPSIPYSGPLYVNQKKDINYGVSFVIPINHIKQFILDNHKDLASKGFDIIPVINNN
ncbi:MAG: trypsin-like peptidase domain-containing protein [Bacteroidales bacterium]|nr:trypsin-like peptidase domain-containing protein [Bacteroidales bacterium]